MRTAFDPEWMTRPKDGGLNQSGTCTGGLADQWASGNRCDRKTRPDPRSN
ncbi:MAG: hypothetical protein HC827_06020 [Cyanobacteria bacterium RM1_2_2]|nr:hypothetical protein [Cyanobacteria bacterium RM1_2_2]